MAGDGGGVRGVGWRVAEVVLLIYDFLTFPNREGFRVYAEQRRRGAKGWEVEEGYGAVLK